MQEGLLEILRRCRAHSVQEVVANESVDIRVNNKIKTGIKIQYNIIDLFAYKKIVYSFLIQD